VFLGVTWVERKARRCCGELIVDYGWKMLLLVWFSTKEAIIDIRFLVVASKERCSVSSYECSELIELCEFRFLLNAADIYN